MQVEALLWPLSTGEANMVAGELLVVDPARPNTLYNCFWLRSAYDRYLIVQSDSSYTYYGTCVSDKKVRKGSISLKNNYFVRPAFQLNMNDVLLTSASDGKESGEEGADALIKKADTSAGEWKMTLRDSERNFTVTERTHADNGVKIKYEGARTGDSEFISAIIKNSSGEVTYYGRMKRCASAEDTSGEITINTDGRLSDGDTLYVFNEQYNGSGKTDYASELKEVKIPQQVSYSITFKVANGKWDDGTAEDRKVTKNGWDSVHLDEADIPAAGSRPDKTYQTGSWDVTPDTGTEISEDTTYTYTYAPVLYTVTFSDGQGNTLKNEEVQESHAATAPADPAREGYTFTGWDVDFSKITADLTVTARWKENPLPEPAQGADSKTIPGPARQENIRNGGMVLADSAGIHPKGTRLKKPVSAKKTITVRWKKQSAKIGKSHITGYQIQLATNRRFTRNRKTVNVKGYKKVSRKVTKLKSGKKYYIRIRTYKKVKGKKYYSVWSKVRTVKT